MDRSSLKTLFIKQITHDLTTFREENGNVAYTQDLINEFVNQNNDGIEQAIDYLLENYDEGDPEDDWITEALYEFVDTFD